MTDTVTQADLGVFKAETRNYQHGLAAAVMELQDGLAEMQTGLTEMQTGLTKMRGAADKMADVLTDD